MVTCFPVHVEYFTYILWFVWTVIDKQHIFFLFVEIWWYPSCPPPLLHDKFVRHANISVTWWSLCVCLFICLSVLLFTMLLTYFHLSGGFLKENERLGFSYFESFSYKFQSSFIDLSIYWLLRNMKDFISKTRTFLRLFIYSFSYQNYFLSSWLVSVVEYGYRVWGFLEKKLFLRC